MAPMDRRLKELVDSSVTRISVSSRNKPLAAS